MRLLLDTHVLLWLARTPEVVSARVRDAVVIADERVVSSATAYEIALKTRLGRLPGGAEVLYGWSRLLQDMLATELPLTVPHMIRAGSLDWDHRDPFDRMLVAQAQVEGFELLTRDASIQSFGEAPTAAWD